MRWKHLLLSSENYYNGLFYVFVVMYMPVSQKTYARFLPFQIWLLWPGMVIRVCNPSTWEAR
jgi:hypothetical protein